MNTFKAFIRNGRVEPDAPLNLPEGTEVLILPTAVREALIKDLAARKEWELAQDEQRNKRLRDLWE